MIKRLVKYFVYRAFDRDVLSGKSVVNQAQLRELPETTFYESASVLSIEPRRYHVVPGKDVPSWLSDFREPRKYNGASFTVLNDACLIGRHGTVIHQGKIALDSILNSIGYLLHKSEKRLIRFYKRLPVADTFDFGISLANCLSNNYFHWVGETLPMLEALLICKQTHKGSKPIVFVSGDPPKFVLEYLELFGIGVGQVVPLSSSKIKVQQLIVPSTRFYALKNPHDNWCRHIYPKSAFDFVRHSLASKSLHDPLSPKKIYVSRNDAVSRKVVNEPELLPLLNEYGYLQVSLAALTVGEQIKLFYNLTHLITPHGAGLTNTIFSSNLHIIELYPHNRAFGYNYHYFQISAHYDHQHTLLLCPGDEDENMAVAIDVLIGLIA